MASGGIGRASALLASGTLVSRVLGFVKAIVLAQTIGVIGNGADAFANANMLPSSIYSLIAGGVLNAVLVPQVVRAARHDDGGQQYINRLVTLTIAVLGGIALLATVGVPVIAGLYGASLDPELLSLVIAFGYWCMPQIFFYGLYAVLGEVLNARGLFGPFTWAPVLNNIIGIGFLWMFAAIYGADPLGERLISEWTPDMIALLGLTTTAGVACQALVLFFFWRRVGLTFRPDFRWRGTGLGKAGKLAGWTFGMLLVMQFAGLVETIVLNIAAGQTAAIAAFQNAYLIFVLPHSIITVSIATAYFTRMSTAASEHRIRDLVRDFSGGARLIGLFIVFSAWAIAVISPAFTRVFTQSQDAVTEMAIILCCFLVGLVTFCGLFLVQRAFFALEDTRTQFWLFLATMPVHIFGMAIVATMDVRFIAAGLALMQSIMSAIRLVVLLWLLRRRIGHLDTRRIVRSYTTFAIGTLAAAAVGFGVMWLLGTYSPDGFARSGIAAALVSCAIGGVVMAMIYAIMLIVLRSPDFLEAATPILRRAGLERFLGSTAVTSGDDRDGDAADEARRDDSGPDAPRGPGGPGTTRVGADSSDEPHHVRDDEQRALEDGWSAWLDDAGAPMRQREEEAYTGAFASMGAREDLSTAGILLPMHARARTESSAQSRRDRRRLEQDAARDLAERHPVPPVQPTDEPHLAPPADVEPADVEPPAPPAPASATDTAGPVAPVVTPRAPQLPSDEPPPGPRGAADRRRAQLRNAERDRLADEAFREQRRQAAARQRQRQQLPQAQPPAPRPVQAPQPRPTQPPQPRPTQPPEPTQASPAGPHAHPPRNEPPAQALGGPITDDARDPDEDVRSLFDELFGDEER